MTKYGICFSLYTSLKGWCGLLRMEKQWNHFTLKEHRTYNGMSSSNLSAIIDQFSSCHILCIGDVMLDQFVYGKVSRISPEAPVPVIRERTEKMTLGGAGNVVANLRSLSCRTSFLGAVGQDENAQKVRDYLNGLGLENVYLQNITDYITTIKTRYVAGGHHLLRVDREMPLHIADEELSEMLEQVENLVQKVDLVLLSDYGKGLFDERFTPAVVKLCRQYGKPVIVDPKRFDYTIYRGVTLVKPNLKEFSGAVGRTFDAKSPDFAAELSAAGRALCGKYEVENLLVTLSEHGMIYIPSASEKNHRWIPTEARDVYDVVGAGDTTLATLGAAMATGADFDKCMRIANAAAGVVVSKFGTACVTCRELKEKLSLRKEAGVVTLKEAVEIAESLKAQGKLVGFTNGCFDILHPGHIQSFAKARALCDVLFVGLNSDESIRRLKGPSRPINNQTDRATMVTALASVDYVIVFDEDSPLPLLEKLRPDVIAKEGYAMDNWRSGRFVESYGGQAVILPRVEGCSTTGIIEKLGK